MNNSVVQVHDPVVSEGWVPYLCKGEVLAIHVPWLVVEQLVVVSVLLSPIPGDRSTIQGVCVCVCV